MNTKLHPQPFSTDGQTTGTSRKGKSSVKYSTETILQTIRQRYAAMAARLGDRHAARRRQLGV